MRCFFACTFSLILIFFTKYPYSSQILFSLLLCLSQHKLKILDWNTAKDMMWNGIVWNGSIGYTVSTTVKSPTFHMWMKKEYYK